MDTLVDSLARLLEEEMNTWLLAALGVAVVARLTRDEKS